MSRLDYEAWVAEALLTVVPRALATVAEHGLPEGHALYVSFDTRHEEVRLDAAMAERHPDLMTIVLEHQFWDLALDDAGFSVVLAFGGERRSLYVPWAAVRAFADPPAEFAFDTSRHLAAKLRQLVGEQDDSDDSASKTASEASQQDGETVTVSDRFARTRPERTALRGEDQESQSPAGEVVPFARPEEE